MSAAEIGTRDVIYVYRLAVFLWFLDITDFSVLPSIAEVWDNCSDLASRCSPSKIMNIDDIYMDSDSYLNVLVIRTSSIR